MSQGARPAVSAQYLSELGCGRQMLDALGKLGAKVDYSDEKSGFALVTIAREKLLDSLDVAAIEYAYTRNDNRMYYQDADAKIPQSERKPEPVPKITIPYPRVTKTLLLDGPYFAADEIGLTQLWKAHPDADGRGVTAAVIDEGLDLLHPALLQARDANGHVVPKVADQISLDSPNQDGSWVQMGQLVKATAGVFDAAGRTWTTPSSGTYRFGIYKHELVLGPEGNSHTKKLSLSVGMLWDEQRDTVWVDTDGDGSFQNQRALGDYGATRETDWFGTKDGADDNRIPFGVKIDKANHAIFLTIADGGHGAGIAGSLAANRLTGGLYDGAAPGAQLIDARDNRLMQLPLMLEMEAREDVGVLSRSGGFARAGYTGMAAGIEDFQRHVAERMTKVYGKPMACVCTANGLISVDDFASGEMLRRNRRTSPPYVDTLHPFYGADRTWGLVNSIYAPSAQLNTESRYMPFGLMFPDGRRHTFADSNYDPPAPPGYWIGANESPTVPVVSGVVADLIGEAKREHVRWDVARLNQAMFAGAKLIDGIPMYEQGYGLVNAAGAWEQLVKMAKADDPKNPELTLFTFSDRKGSNSPEVDGYYREVVKPGGEMEDAIWVTRHGGYAGARSYSFSLKGNDGTLTLLTREAELKRDEPAAVRFRSKLVSGFHVVMVELKDDATGTVMQLVPLSIKVPDTPEVLAPGVEKYSAAIAPRRDDARLIYFDSNVQAARWQIMIPYERNDNDAYGPGIRCGAKKPDGPPLDAEHHVGPLAICNSLMANGSAGFQYVHWENRAFHAEYETPYDPPDPPAPTVPITGTAIVTKYAVDIRHDDSSLILANKLAVIDGRTELYDATLKTQSLTGAGLHAIGETMETLPDHLAGWRVRVTADASLNEPADVYVLNCTGENGCSVAATEEITATMKTVMIDRPAAGTWKIIVRSRDQVQHPLSYSIHQALLTPAATPIDAADSQHSSGASWTLPLPKTQSDAQYAAFRIAGTPGVASEKNGLVVAMTPLDQGTP